MDILKSMAGYNPSGASVNDPGQLPIIDAETLYQFIGHPCDHAIGDPSMGNDGKPFVFDDAWADRVRDFFNGRLR